MKTHSQTNEAEIKKKSRLPVILGVLFLVLVGGLFLSIKLFDPNSLREPISSALSRASGLDVKIESLGLVFDGSIKLRCNGVRVLTPIGSRELFSAETLLLDAELAPLLKKQVRINKASIIRPVLQLYIKEEGQDEQEDVAKPDSEPATPGTTTAPTSPTEAEDSKLLIKIRNVLGEADLSLPYIEIEDGRIELRRKNPEKVLPINFSTQLEILRQNPGKVDINVKSFESTITKIHLFGHAEALNLLTDSATVSLDLETDTLDLADLNILQNFFSDAATETPAPLGTGTLNRAVIHVSSPFESVFSMEALKASAHADLAFALKDVQAQGISFPKVTGEAAWQESRLSHKLQGDALGGNFSLQGTLTPGTEPNQPASLQSEITWSEMDLAQVKLDKTWVPSSGKTSGTMDVSGDLPSEGEDFWAHLHIKTSLQGKNLDVSVPGNSKPVTLGELSIKASLQKNQLTHQAQTSLFDGTLEESGTLLLPGENSPATRIDSKISFNKIDAAQLEFLKTISWAPGGGRLSGTINLKGELPQEGASALDQLQIQTTLQGENTLLNVPPDMKPLEIAIKQINVEGTLYKKQFTHKIKAALFDGEINESGVLTLPKTENAATGISSDVEWKNINLSRVRSPVQNEWVPAGGITYGTLNILGSLGGPESSAFKNLRFKGKLGAKKLSLGVPEPRHKAAGLLLILNEESKNLTTAQLQVDGGQINNLAFKKVQGLFHIEPDIIRIIKARITPSHGILDLKGGFRPVARDYELEFAGENLLIEDFWSEALEGPGNVTGKLKGDLLALDKVKAQGKETNYKHLLQGMSGTLNLNLADGKVTISRSFEALLNLLNPTALVTAQKKGLNYKHLGGDIKIQKGVAQTDNFALQGPQMNVLAAVQANFHNDALRGEIKAMPLQLLDNVIKAVPLLGQILTGGKKGGVIEAYFDLGGTLEKPEVSLSTSKSLLKKPGRMVDEIIDLPGSILGTEKKK